MEGFITCPGEVVTVKFPYTDDEAGFKSRPALVIATPQESVSILCEITTNLMQRPHTVPLSQKDFLEGGLRKQSVIRADVIVTMHNHRLKERVGSISEPKFQEVRSMLAKLFRIAD